MKPMPKEFGFVLVSPVYLLSTPSTGIIVLEGGSSARHNTCHLASCICCNQSAVKMRIGAGLTSAKLTLFFRSSTAGWTTDSKYVLGAEFSLHGDKIMPQRFIGWSILNSFGNFCISGFPRRGREPNQGFAIAGWLGNRFASCDPRGMLATSRTSLNSMTRSWNLSRFCAAAI